MICEFCKKEFKPGKFKNTQKYCNKKCKELARNKRRSQSGQFARNAKEYRIKHIKKIQQYDRDRISKRQQSGENAYYKINLRCNNVNHPSYRYYGAKGIKNLLTKEQFLEIYFSTNECSICHCVLKNNTTIDSQRRTLDRIDSTKHYEDNNVRVVCLGCNVKESHKQRCYEGKCLTCGHSFLTKSHKKQYCSRKCYWKSYYGKDN
jgi:hypothetical protein